VARLLADERSNVSWSDEETCLIQNSLLAHQARRYPNRARANGDLAYLWTELLVCFHLPLEDRLALDASFLSADGLPSRHRRTLHRMVARARVLDRLPLQLHPTWVNAVSWEDASDFPPALSEGWAED